MWSEERRRDEAATFLGKTSNFHPRSAQKELNPSDMEKEKCSHENHKCI